MVLLEAILVAVFGIVVREVIKEVIKDVKEIGREKGNSAEFKTKLKKLKKKLNESDTVVKKIDQLNERLRKLLKEGTELVGQCNAVRPSDDTEKLIEQNNRIKEILENHLQPPKKQKQISSLLKETTQMAEKLAETQEAETSRQSKSKKQKHKKKK